MVSLDTLKFDTQGLIPAIVQDAGSGRVLMLAYMNRESLEVSLTEGYTCFWSRSRQELWRKGTTSGNRQRIVSLTPDCDSDTLLVQVIKEGPACHQGTDSCFTEALYQNTEAAQPFQLAALYDLLRGRQQQPQEGSYTSYLFAKGLDKILKKVGEETSEVIIAAKNDNQQELVYELADLAYHALVLMLQQGLTLDQIAAELASRHVVDKKVKQETMR